MSKTLLNGRDAQIFSKIEEQIPGTELVGFFKTGSTARVYHVHLPLGMGDRLKVDRIIKVFRNKIEQTMDLDVDEVFQDEIIKLISVSHNNVISVYNAGYLIISDKEKLPYYIMEFLPSARDFDKWLKENINQLDRETIIQLLLQAAHGIKALHVKGIIHCDLKFGNMLIGESRQLKIADLGFAKYLTRKTGEIGLYTSFRYFPKRYHDHLVDMKDKEKRQIYAELPADRVNVSFDLHYFGKLILEIIEIIESTRNPSLEPLLSELDHKSLKLTANRLDLDSPAPFLPMYDNIQQLIFDLEKIQGLYLNRAGVEELSSYTGTRTLRIPVSGSIPFPGRVKDLIHHTMFFRLNNVQQLGLTHYVFPGAMHTRLEHSIGVFSNVSNYINSMLADDYQPYFRQLVDGEMIVTALLAGLLHDIGQHSFAHSLQDMGITERHEDVAEMFITGEGLEKFVKPESNIESLKKEIQEHWPEVQIDRLCSLIKNTESEQTTGIGWDIIRNVLSGHIDADKTDYLIRDALHTGVEYPRSIDITRFMNSITASLREDGEDTKGVLAITWKGKQSAENIRLARSQMFWVLYWHHAVRCAHAMLAHACTSHLKILKDHDKLSFNETLYWRTSGEFISYLKLSESSRARELANWLSTRRLFKRAIELNYDEDESLYNSLLNKKDEIDRTGDMILSDLSRKIAEQLNHIFGKSLPRELSEDDIIVDIPKGDKDKLGKIYVVEKGADIAVPYVSKGLSGNDQDWQNRVRTIRIFIDPDVDVTTREQIAKRGKNILRTIV